MGYAGIILGIIGTLVGLGGLWLSYKNYRWIKSQKIIDIRLALIKSVMSAHELVRVVQEKIRSARLSRSRPELDRKLIPPPNNQILLPIQAADAHVPMPGGAQLEPVAV